MQNILTMSHHIFSPVLAWSVLAIAGVVLSTQTLAQERQRADIPPQHTWNLADLYPSLDAWRAAKEDDLLRETEIHPADSLFEALPDRREDDPGVFDF